MAYLIMAEGAAPSTPSSGKATVFIDTSGNLCKLDDAGNLMTLVAAGDYTLTIPATGTVALLGAAQTFTGAPSIQAPLIFPVANLTIASGIITVTQVFHNVDTEASAASDDLVTINGGSFGQILILQSTANGRDVTVKHGTGNIFLHGAADFTLSNVRDKLMLLRSNGGEWCEIGRGDNGV